MLLALGYTGCILAGVSHLYPIPFPDNTFLLIGCVAAYMVLSGCMQFIMSFIQKERIISTSSKQGVWRGVSSKLDKYSDLYCLTLEVLRGEKSKTVQLQKSYGAWFEESGAFHADLFKQDLAALIKKAKAK